MVPHTPSGVWTFTGPPAAGKSTLMASIGEIYPSAVQLRRHMTRPPKASDVLGQFVYLTREEFERMYETGEFYRKISVHGHLYGTLNRDIEEMAQSDNLTLVEFTHEGVEYLWQVVPRLNPTRKLKSIFLYLDDESEQRRRLIKRGERDVELRITDSRGWHDEARSSSVPYFFIDANQSKDQVLRHALEYLLS